MTKNYLIVALVLYTFWLLLSGHYNALLLAAGAASALLVSWLLARMNRIDGETPTLRPTLGLLRYGAWLLWTVVKSNLDVARRIWDPSLPIHPTWSRLDTRVSTPLQKALYANSITLTPGTLTTDVRDDHFLVHSLSREGIEELRAGEMERRIRDLGI